MDLNELSKIPMDLFINIINIILLFIIVRALVYKPVKKFLDDRITRVEKTIGDANALKSEAQKTIFESDSIIAEAKKKADEIITDAENKARKNADSIKGRAENEAAELKSKVLKELEDERDQMINSSREEIAELSTAIAEKILKREVSNDDTRKIAEEFFDSEGNEL